MIGGVEKILALIVNSLFDISDSVNSKKVTDLNANVIEIACAVTNDLPSDLYTDYCKSLEIMYAALTRAVVQSVIRNRGNSSAKDVLKSIPILTNYDLVDFDEELGAISSLSESLFGKKKGKSGSAAVSAFLESVNKEISDQAKGDYMAGLEADVFLKETRGGIPQFVDVVVTITTVGGRTIDKVIPIGISVKPKPVSPQEMIGFFIKQNKSLVNITNESKIKAKKFAFKSLFAKKKLENQKIEGGILDNSSKRVLANILESTKKIEKPFVCLLLSSYTSELLKDAGVDVSKPSLIKHIYNTLPVMSIGIYDMSLDLIYYSLYKGQTTLTKATASSFNTDVSQLQKTLAEGLRVSRMLS